MDPKFSHNCLCKKEAEGGETYTQRRLYDKTKRDATTRQEMPIAPQSRKGKEGFSPRISRGSVALLIP